MIGIDDSLLVALADKEHSHHSKALSVFGVFELVTF
jgi:hypothetical protein